METPVATCKRQPWNKGKIDDQKTPLNAGAAGAVYLHEALRHLTSS